jgi:hypothetical protein
MSRVSVEHGVLPARSNTKQATLRTRQREVGVSAKALLTKESKIEIRGEHRIRGYWLED